MYFILKKRYTCNLLIIIVINFKDYYNYTLLMNTKFILVVALLIISTLQLSLHLTKTEPSNDQNTTVDTSSDVSSDGNTTAALNSTKAEAKEARAIKEETKQALHVVLGTQKS